MLAPFTGCCFISANSSSVKLAGLFQDAIVHADFADVVKQRGNAQAVEVFRVQAQIFADDGGIFCDAAGMTSGIGILFVNGGGEHADGA